MPPIFFISFPKLITSKEYLSGGFNVKLKS